MSEREYYEDDDLSEDNLSELDFNGHYFHDDSADDQDQVLEDYYNMVESGVDDSSDEFFGFHIDEGLDADFNGEE